MSFTLEDWLKNYKNETAVAKSAMESVQNINGGDYIPWAMMYRVLVELDPNAVVEKVENENGGYVFYDEHFLVNETRVVENGEEKVSSTKVPNLAFYVKVKLTFHGKEYLETMPVIASNTRRGTVTKTFDNMAVHNALQRGMAKVISMATGVGLSLWTREEFDTEEEVEKSPILPKEEKKVDHEEQKAKAQAILAKVQKEKEEKEVKKEEEKPIDIMKPYEMEESPLKKKEKPKKVEKKVEENDDTQKIVDIITKHRHDEKLQKSFNQFNVVLKIKNAEVDLENDTATEIYEKINKLGNVKPLLEALEKGLGI